MSQASCAPEPSILIELIPQRLQGLRALAERWAIHADFNHLESGKILAAVDEALSNIHQHAYGGRSGPVQIEIRVEKGELIFEFTDQGKEFDPTHSISRKPGEIGTGGWGLVLVHGAFDRVERRRQAGKNILLLARRLPPTQESK